MVNKVAFVGFSGGDTPSRPLQGSSPDPTAALWRWRNNGGTCTSNSFYILFLVKGVVSYPQIISVRLYFCLKGTCTLAAQHF